ncbi:MAG: ABC transporter substrate-binding protein [Deltaproteobacteria bacterium]|nr:ABC transporter substrate-binding protein [Deltaproteobacteria bacterium]
MKQNAARLFSLRTLAAIGFIVFLVGSPAGEISAGEAAPKKDIRVRVSIPSISFAQLPLQAGAQLGVFRAEGLDVSTEELKPTASIAGLINGEIQFMTGGSSAMRAAASGAPVKLLTGGSEKPAFYLVSQPGIEKVADLKGKIVAVTSLTSLTDVITRDVLKQHGLSPEKDVQIMALGSTANILAGLTSKQVQGGILSPPFDSLARKSGLRVLLFAGDFVQALQGGMASSNQQIAANPEMIKRFIRGYIRSIQFTQSNKDKVVPVISKIFNLDPDSASQAYDSVKGIWRADGGVSKQVLQKEIDAWKATTKTARDVSLNDLVDFSFLRQAQQELGVKPLD